MCYWPKKIFLFVFDDNDRFFFQISQKINLKNLRETVTYLY